MQKVIRWGSTDFAEIWWVGGLCGALTLYKVLAKSDLPLAKNGQKVLFWSKMHDFHDFRGTTFQTLAISQWKVVEY